MGREEGRSRVLGEDLAGSDLMLGSRSRLKLGLAWLVVELPECWC